MNGNVSGAKQRIYETSLGFGHFLSDRVILKLEGRFDVVDPVASALQWIAGAAMGMSCAF